MAFSYSDKNFTVIGNLCFVHIFVKGTDVNYAIPPAIRDRMLVDDFVCLFAANNFESADFGGAQFNNGNIHCISSQGSGYLFCYFPIDSNK